MPAKLRRRRHKSIICVAGRTCVKGGKQKKKQKKNRRPYKRTHRSQTGEHKKKEEKTREQ